MDFNQSTYAGRVAVITGAASGIGQELAFQLAAAGARLMLADQNLNGLQNTAERIHKAGVSGVQIWQVDVADQQQMEQFATQTLEHFSAVDYLFNNAGVSLSVPVAQMSYEDFHWLMGINFWGVVHGTKSFLPAMLMRNQGHIVNISSLFGLLAMPSQSAYNASKFAVRGFTEALRAELTDSQVRAHCVHPGGVKTNIARNARFIQDTQGNSDKDRFVKTFEEHLADTSAAQAANQILTQLAKGSERILVGSDAQMLDKVQRFFPETYVNKLVAKLKKMRAKREAKERLTSET